MTPNKPYLIRALHEWILDNNMTPFLLVDANVDGVVVPEQHVKDGKIILNVVPNAVQEITLDNDRIYFSARFNGNSFMINIPVKAVLAIYASENGRGMMFAEDESLAENKAEDRQEKPGKKPILKVIK